MEAVGDLASDVESFFESDPNICTIHEIDEVNGRTFLALEFVEGDSLEKKIEGGGFRFPLEALAALLIGEQVRRQKLQRHGSPELGVLSLVNNSHPPFAELADDPVMRDGLSDHCLKSCNADFTDVAHAFLRAVSPFLAT